MGIVAVGAEIVNPLTWTGKVSHPFPMNADLPVLIYRTVALPAEPIAFGKVDQIPVIEPELISILHIMAIKTPSHGFGVMELDIGMLFFQLSFLSIHLHRGMTVAAGVHSLGHRRRGIFINDCHCGESEKKQQ
jgi:hypothetical protein